MIILYMFKGTSDNTYCNVVIGDNNKCCAASSSVPTASSTIQPTCGTPSGTIVFSTQTGVEYSLNEW
jgi:hypothetical protein